MAGIFGLREVRTEQITKITGNRQQYGYFAGGSSPVVNTIDRLDFSNETVSTPGNNLPEETRFLAGLSSPEYGYFGGGYSPDVTPTLVCTIGRLDFSNETTSNPPASLTQARYGLAAVSNSNYGYFSGGRNPSVGPPTYVATTDRLDFSNETVSAPGNDLTEGRHLLAAVSNSQYGYFAGGSDASANVCTIDRLDFSNETVSAPGNDLTKARDQLAAVSSPQYGYFGGGGAPAVATRTCIIERLDFSNETVSEPGTYQLTKARADLVAVSNPEYGYFGGGNNPTNTILSTIDRLDFSNETVSAPGNDLTQARNEFAAVSRPLKEYTISPTSWPELAEFGYYGGGQSPNITGNIIDRLDFSNETISLPGNNLTVDRKFLAAVSNSNYGYFGGGQTPPNACTIDRLDFSNETVSAPGISPGQLTQARRFLSAVSNSNYGYFGGGGTPTTVSTIDRLDFSNETVIAPGNDLPQARYRLIGVSNSNYGYFGGGYAPGPITFSTISSL
jgi:hypothetical protein